MARIRFAQKKVDDAIPYLQAVLRVEPNDAQANMTLARYYESRGNRDRAITHVEAVHRTQTADPEFRIKQDLARLYASVGRTAEAITLAKEIVASDPKSVAAHTRLGTLYLGQGNVPAAIDSLVAATRLDPNYAPARTVLGTAYERKGDSAAALNEYKRAMALNPKDAGAMNNTAYIYASQGKQLDEALTLAGKAQQLAPDNAKVLDTLGFVHYRRGEFSKVELILKKAGDASPKNATIAYHLGMTYYKLGRNEDAATALRRALQLQESLPQAGEIRAVLAELKK